MTLTFLEAAAKNLMAEFEASKAVHHHGLKGDIRENAVIKTFLSKHLPQKYNIGSGVIVNADSDQSRQQDIIIYDAFNCPLLHNEENTKIVPIENVYSTLEVKSTLTKSELKKCIENIKSVKSLSNPNTLPSGFVFAFQSDSSIDNVCKNLIEFNAEVPSQHQINAVCILDKGVIAYFHKHGLTDMRVLHDEDCYAASIQGTPERNLILFYLLLMTALSQKAISPPDLITYASKQGIFEATNYTFPKQGFTDDTFLLNAENNERVYVNQHRGK
ncbi:hypothetical protein GBN78_11680 [Bacillus sp. B2-WWTP-C-10-Post-4]|uniref:DUF6602 domain-containing protein n=1 Tax=Bacillus sp. B2-WWTP-C-10-Post-4 TaxID=2653218 RepID=UPI0012627D87|nr:DUF6602 domain-containing protein [Bacillus sp. B2-WWTP-C-10-Post-4]KAB7656681.1 hypothetical protein GBN78_11680 [Bacillus sp. B2-WWTP-C-10-Post-4]